eukprot:TRINITY_DN983_c1_g1_i3.p1 TRINITY_DN983_c1_g1~~TRINITY_DN983_c1_g1_i3.p1  ORF type:complete len:255 (+),score=16.50 TRINITY_DN983_c1_g1_i3:64-828(+)
MAKKKKQAQAAESHKLPDPWCYYCDKRFKSEGVLIQHQKEKHFKCEICQRKLTSANGMKSHCLKRHSVNVEKVPNALEGRENFAAEVYGMKGVPANMLTEHERMIYGVHEPPPMMGPMGMPPVPYGYPPGMPPPPFMMPPMPMPGMPMPMPMPMPGMPMPYPPYPPHPFEGHPHYHPGMPPHMTVPGGPPGMAPPYVAYSTPEPPVNAQERTVGQGYDREVSTGEGKEGKELPPDVTSHQSAEQAPEPIATTDE